VTGPEMQRDAAIFWMNVERKPGGCWEWTASHNEARRGYGQAKFRGRVRQAHLIAYELLIGPIPEGLQLDHLCRNTACVNPVHLEPVTQRENILRSDAPSAIAYRADTCTKGHPLTPENVYRRPSKPTKRECRICMYEGQRARRARRKEAAGVGDA
jgi:hypothetical protein